MQLQETKINMVIRDVRIIEIQNIGMYFIKWKRVVTHGNKNLSELTQV